MKFVSNVKIKTKINFAIGVLISLLLFVNTYSIINNDRTQTSYGELLEDEKIKVTLKSIQFRLAGLSNDERAYLLTGKQEYVEGMLSKNEDIKKYFESFGSLRNLDEEDHQMLNKIEKSYTAYSEVSTRVVEAYKQGDKEQANKLHFTEERDLRKKSLDPAINSFLKKVDEETKQDLINRQDESRLQTAILSSIAVLSTIFGILIGYLLLRSIIKPLQIVNRQLKEISEGEGDLTKEITAKFNDEIGELTNSFNNMVRSLRNLIQQVSSTTIQVAASSEELTASAEQSSKASEVIAHAIQEVSLGSERQVDSVEESSKTVTEISMSVQRIAVSSQNVTDAAIHASEKAITGNHAIQTAIKQMNSISQTTDSLAQVVEELGERSQEIGQIVEVITGISTQTNLLALNAAIEAARAGEHGRGFAIVADEVRKLAEQSGSSAQKISELIVTIQKVTNQAVQSMHTATKEVANGIEMVNTAGESFGQIQLSVNEVDNQIKEVSTAVQQVVIGTEQMVHSIDVVTKVAKEAASGTQEVSAAAEEQLASMEEITLSASSLSKMAEELRVLIGKFKV